MVGKEAIANHGVPDSDGDFGGKQGEDNRTDNHNELQFCVAHVNRPG
jgi:hypothetical protein